jgi:plastocyanin
MGGALHRPDEELPFLTLLTDGARRRLLPISGLLMAAVLAACSGANATPSTSVACQKADANNVVQLSAANVAFSAPCIEVTADAPITIQFTNSDTVPHDLAVYQDSTKATEVFRGEVADAGQSKTYDVPAVAAGDHFFVCTIHTTMTGVLRAVPGTGGSSPA